MPGIHDPSRLHPRAFARIAERFTKSTSTESADRTASAETPSEVASSTPSSHRVASTKEIPSEFRHVGAGLYMHRDAHALWELRAAEDSLGGYVLVRKHEERAVDMRQDSPRDGSHASGTSSSIARLAPGTRVAAIRRGQVQNAVVIMMAPPAPGQPPSAMVDFGHGQIEPVPLEEVTPLTPQPDATGHLDGIIGDTGELAQPIDMTQDPQPDEAKPVPGTSPMKPSMPKHMSPPLSLAAPKPPVPPFEEPGSGQAAQTAGEAAAGAAHKAINPKAQMEGEAAADAGAMPEAHEAEPEPVVRAIPQGFAPVIMPSSKAVGDDGALSPEYGTVDKTEGQAEGHDGPSDVAEATAPQSAGEKFESPSEDSDSNEPGWAWGGEGGGGGESKGEAKAESDGKSDDVKSDDDGESESDKSDDDKPDAEKPKSDKAPPFGKEEDKSGDEGGEKKPESDKEKPESDKEEPSSDKESSKSAASQMQRGTAQTMHLSAYLRLLWDAFSSIRQAAIPGMGPDFGETIIADQGFLYQNPLNPRSRPARVPPGRIFEYSGIENDPMRDEPLHRLVDTQTGAELLLPTQELDSQFSLESASPRAPQYRTLPGGQQVRILREDEEDATLGDPDERGFHHLPGVPMGEEESDEALAKAYGQNWVDRAKGRNQPARVRPLVPRQTTPGTGPVPLSEASQPGFGEAVTQISRPKASLLGNRFEALARRIADETTQPGTIDLDDLSIVTMTDLE